MLSVFLALSITILPAAGLAGSGTLSHNARDLAHYSKVPRASRVDVSKLPPPQVSSETVYVPAPGRSLANSPYTNPTSSPASRVVSQASGPFTTSSSTVGIALSFDGLNGIQSCNCTPPDVQVAAGPNHVMEMVNLAGEVFSKQGAVIERFGLSSFWNTTGLSDPKVFFDTPSGRWFSSIIVVSQDKVLVAVSSTNDPTGIWNIYPLFPASGVTLPDQPIIGVSNDKIVVSVNDFNGNGFMGAQYWVLNKNEMVAGSSSIDTASLGPFSNLASVHPVQSLSSTTTEYMVSTGGETVSAGNSVKLISVTGTPPGTVTNQTVSIPVSAIVSPIGMGQPGQSLLNYTTDQRVLDAVWFQGKLWLGLDVTCTPPGDTVRSCIRLAQIATSTSTLIQDFNFSSPNQFLFYPALRVDSKGNLDVIYGYSSSTAYPSLAVTGQAVTDPLNSLAPSKVLKLGSAPEQVHRYGDYFGAGVDPSDQATVWVAGEYHTADTGLCPIGGSCWSTFIGSISMTPGFSLSAPNSAFAVGSAGSLTVSVNSLHGFQGTVSLSATVSPTGPKVLFSPVNVGVAAGGTGASTLTFSTKSSAIKGLDVVNITGTSGSMSHSVLMTVAVTAFSVNISNTTTFTGITVKTSGTISIDSPSNRLTLSGVVGVTATNSSTQVLLFAKNYTISQLALQSTSAGRAQVKFLLNVGTSLPLSSNLIISIFGTTSTISSAGYPVTRNLDIDGNGIVDIADSNIVKAAYNSTIGSPNYNPKADVDGDGVVNIVDAAIVAFYFGTQDFIPNFAISAAPTTLNLLVGSPGTASITLSSLNGFSGTVNLSLSVTPSSATVSLNQTTIVLSPGGTHSSTLTFSTSSTGTYTVNITGTSGILSHSAIVTVYVPDFSMVSNAQGEFTQVKIGTSVQFLITLASLAPFSGTVGLGLTVPTGVTATLTSTSAAILPGGIEYSSLNVTVKSQGVFTITVSGTSGSISHSLSITVEGCITVPNNCPQIIIVQQPSDVSISDENTASLRTIPITPSTMAIVEKTANRVEPSAS